MPIDASPPNLHDEMCGGKHKRPASDEDEEAVAGNASGETGATFFAAGLQPPVTKPADLIAAAPAPFEPIPVYTGPTKTGAALIAAVATDTEKQAVRPKGKKARLATKKRDVTADTTTDSKTDAKSDIKSDAKTSARTGTAKSGAAKSGAAKSGAAKPVRHANAKPDAVPAVDKSAAKPAKPKAAAKPSSKPAPKNTSSNASKPAG